MQVTIEQIGELLDQIRSDRVSREKLQRFLENPNFERKGEEVFGVHVNYSMTLAQMIAAGRYDWKNGDITPEHFPIVGTGTVDVELHLVHLNRLATTEKVEDDLDFQNLRPATLAELLALGAKYPEEQRKFPIPALGSDWVSPRGHRDVPCLDGSGSGRSLRLVWGDPDDQWYGGCRFAAVRK